MGQRLNNYFPNQWNGFVPVARLLTENASYQTPVLENNERKHIHKAKIGTKWITE